MQPPRGRNPDGTEFVGVRRSQPGAALGKWVIEHIWAVDCQAEIATSFLDTVNLRLLETSK